MRTSPNNPLGLKVDRSKLIDSDRACAKCGYCLRGLKTGGKCPECGTRIPHSINEYIDDGVMTDAPPAYLHTISAAALCMALAAPILIIGVIWVLVEMPWNEGFSWWAAAAVGVAGAIWVPGVWLMTLPRPLATPRANAEGKPEWQALRWMARLSQLAWFLGAPVIAGGAMQYVKAFSARPIVVPDSAVILSLMGELMWLVAFVGLAPVALYLARLAYWANDTTLADRLRLVPVGIVAGAILMTTMGLGAMLLRKIGLGMVAVTFVSTGGLLIIAAVAQMLLGLFGLANTARWAIKSRAAMLDSAARRSDRVLERIEAAKARKHANEAEYYEGTKASHAQGQVVKASEAARPYDLEP